MKTPAFKKIKKKKKENLIAGAVVLVRSRSQQSPIIIMLAEAKCATLQEQEQAGRVGEGWNSRGKGAPWASASGIKTPGSQQNPLRYHPLPTPYHLKTPHTNEYIQKPTSKGNMLFNAYANYHLFLCSFCTQPGTAIAAPIIALLSNLVPAKSEAPNGSNAKAAKVKK